MRNLNTPTPQGGGGEREREGAFGFLSSRRRRRIFLSDDDIFNSLVKTKTKIRPPLRLEDKNTHPLLRHGTTTTTTHTPPLLS